MIKLLKEEYYGAEKNLKDETYGDYYGFLSYELELDKWAEKGCILNSRILWFFSNAYQLKCPYHNGRMCMEVMRRAKDILEKEKGSK